MGIDNGYKLIRRFWITPASTAGIYGIDHFLDKTNPNPEVFADCAYRSIDSLFSLIAQGYYCSFHYKAPTDPERIEKNAGWSRIRGRVEHVFGFIENSMGGKFIRTIGLARAKTKIGLMNLTYNFCRFGQLLRAKSAY